MASSRLRPSDLMTLEHYDRERETFRARVKEHRNSRRLQIGPSATWLFEDRLLVQYQVQEALRADRTFEAEGIEDELEAFNPLIPDGTNWKVTFAMEHADRRWAVAKYAGIESRCWVQVEGHDRVYAVADEDLERESDDKSASATVHFLRFELDPAMRASLRKGVGMSAGIAHENYSHAVRPVPDAIRDALVVDLR